MPPEQDDNPFVILGHLYPDAVRIFARRAGMSLQRIEILHQVWHAGEISQAELQQKLDMEGALMTRFAKQMEASGLITRRADPKDNRFTLVSLAPAGQALIEKMDALGEEFKADLLNGISAEELTILNKTLRHLQKNLSKME